MGEVLLVCSLVILILLVVFVTKRNKEINKETLNKKYDYSLSSFKKVNTMQESTLKRFNDYNYNNINNNNTSISNDKSFYYSPNTKLNSIQNINNNDNNQSKYYSPSFCLLDNNNKANNNFNQNSLSKNLESFSLNKELDKINPLISNNMCNNNYNNIVYYKDTSPAGSSFNYNKVYNNYNNNNYNNYINISLEEYLKCKDESLIPEKMITLEEFNPSLSKFIDTNDKNFKRERVLSKVFSSTILPNNSINNTNNYIHNNNNDNNLNNEEVNKSILEDLVPKKIDFSCFKSDEKLKNENSVDEPLNKIKNNYNNEEDKKFSFSDLIPPKPRFESFGTK